MLSKRVPKALKFTEVGTYSEGSLGAVDDFFVELKNARTVALFKVVLQFFPNVNNGVGVDDAIVQFFGNQIQDPRSCHVIVSDPSSIIGGGFFWFRNSSINESQLVLLLRVRWSLNETKNQNFIQNRRELVKLAQLLD